jgi:hypothetical protein
MGGGSETNILRGREPGVEYYRVEWFAAAFLAPGEWRPTVRVR